MGTQTEPTLVEWIAAIGEIATPILLAIFAGVGWSIRQRVERGIAREAEYRQRALKLEQELRTDRLQIYDQVLEPFVLMYISDSAFESNSGGKGKSKQETIGAMFSTVEYRRAVFQLMLFADDSVVRALNQLMDIARKAATGQPHADFGKEIVLKTGDLFLQIRKSVGNEATSLKNLEMLRFFVNDIEKLESRK